MPKHRPRARIEGYHGPYNRRMLEEARQELLSIIDHKDTIIWERIRQKTGIYRNGERDSSEQGYGEASTNFSHADLVEDLDEEQNPQESTIENRSTMEVGQFPPPSSTASLQEISIKRDFSQDHSEKVDRAVTINKDKNVDIFQNENVSVVNQETVVDKGYKKQTVKSEDIISIDCNVDSPDAIVIDDNTDDSVVIEVNIGNSSPCVVDLSDVEFIGEDHSSESKPVKKNAHHTVMFKCDFCDTIKETINKMDEHLRLEMHYCASSYSCDSEGKIGSLIEPSIIYNENALYKTVLAICPHKQCSNIFKTIHECAYHYFQEHGHNTNTRYGLAKIIKEEIRNIPTDKIHCLICSESFNSESLYYKHMNQVHASFGEKKGNGRCYYFCHSCQKFKKNYSLAFSHNSELHFNEIDTTIRKLTIIQVSEVDIHDLSERAVTNVSNVKEVASQNTNSNAQGNGLKVTKGKRKIESSSHAKHEMITQSCLASLKTDQEPIVIEDSDTSKEVIEVSDDSSLNCSVSVQSPNDVKDESQSESNVIIKCDLCETTTSTIRDMKNHLKQAIHYSASSFLQHSDGERTHLKERLVVTYKHALYRSVLVLCPIGPSCGKIFMTIHECSLHYFISHDKFASPSYGLMIIQKEETCEIPIQENGVYCRDCDITLPSKAKYRSHKREESLKSIHWKNCTEEEQERRRTDFGVVLDRNTIYFCHSCQSFKNTYTAACMHVSPKHFKENGIRRLTIHHGGEMKVFNLPENAVPKVEMPGLCAEGMSVLGQLSGPLGETADNYSKVYKCDYCDYIADGSVTIRQHLTTQAHKSASHILIDHDRNPIYLLKPMVVINDQWNMSVIPICPEPTCFMIFKSIYECKEHVAHFHTSLPGRQYALTHVKRQVPIEYDFSQRKFIEKPDIKEHLSGKKSNEFRAFLCVSCRKFCTDAVAMRTHIHQKHPFKNKKKNKTQLNRGIVSIEFFLLRQDKVTHSLLPFQNNPQGMKASLKNQITSLKNLRKDALKQANKVIRKKLKELDKFRG